MRLRTPSLLLVPSILPFVPLSLHRGPVRERVKVSSPHSNRDGCRSGRPQLRPHPTRPAVGNRYRAPRGALEPCGGERTPLLVRRSGPGEAEDSLNRGTPGRVDSSPDKAGTCQHCQMVRVRRVRPEGVTRVNQRLNASQVHTISSNLADVGWLRRVPVRRLRLWGGELFDWLKSLVGRPR